jgi:5-hydroxyisourate hydrolase-like protein (transthyretin family)
MIIRILIVAAILTTVGISQEEKVYELKPGTKGNEITLTVANISEENPATNVNVTLTRKSGALSFKEEIKAIEQIEAKTEAKTTFTFDVNRNVPVNRKDTIDFIISSSEGIMVMKSFIFNYSAPKEFKLEQNFPNPFNPTTTIQYQLPADAKVTLKIYDVLGSEVATLINEDQEAGYKEVKFNATNLASGMYIYRLQAGKYLSMKKMMLVK